MRSLSKPLVCALNGVAAGSTLRKNPVDTLEQALLAEGVPLDFGTRFARELSGGQQQRVALARCFVYQPSVILMDEPFGALDKKLREHMQLEIRHLHRESGATIVYVTHDHDEALALSDRICLMNHARIAQIGTPQEIYTRPRTLFAADFIGISNIFRGRVGRCANEQGPLVTAQGAFRLQGFDAAEGEAAIVIRPEKIVLGQTGDNVLHGEVGALIYAGSETRIVVRLADGHQVVLRLGGDAASHVVGEAITVSWRAEDAVLVP